jgi:hypothetical protein
MLNSIASNKLNKARIDLAKHGLLEGSIDPTFLGDHTLLNPTTLPAQIQNWLQEQAQVSQRSSDLPHLLKPTRLG